MAQNLSACVNIGWFRFGRDQGEDLGITSDDVGSKLNNRKHLSRPPKIVYRNEHPYRLVILNSCNTYSAAWANVFGFDFSPNGSTNDALAYIRQGRQPQAFVGWRQSIQVPHDWDPLGHSEYAEGLAYLFSAWMEGYVLEEGLRQYATYMTVVGFSGHNSWRLSGSTTFYRGVR